MSKSRSRRTATVTTSAPLASRQSRINSSVVYLPVPTNSRLWNECVPITSGSAGCAAAAATADQRNDLEHVSIGNRRVGMPRSDYQVFIALDRDVLGLEPQIPDQRRDGKRPRQSPSVPR